MATIKAPGFTAEASLFTSRENYRSVTRYTYHARKKMVVPFVRLLFGIIFLDPNNTKAITDSLVEKFGTTDDVSIQKQIRPALIKRLLICPSAIILEAVLYG
jgi:hypothetical protein